LKLEFEISWTQWYKPIITATQGVEIQMMIVQSQPRQILRRPHVNKQAAHEPGIGRSSEVRLGQKCETLSEN
jgi:hypothetical protein